jgi:hypothetical protein
MLLILHTVGGIVGLVAGALAARYVSRNASGTPAGTTRKFWLLAWIVGAALGAISFIFVDEIGYGIATPEGEGQVVGIPFFVAFFDAGGNDYVGWITYAGALGNVIVWLLAPQILVALYLRLSGSALTPNTSLERTRDR